MTKENKLIAISEVTINTSPAKVWEALVSPSIIKEYLYGSDVSSEWKVGSDIYFKGEWEGKEYIDKGIIVNLDSEKLFRHTYLPGETEDKPENYSIVTYAIEEHGENVRLQVTQDNVKTDEDKKRYEKNWSGILNTIKNILEKQN